MLEIWDKLSFSPAPSSGRVLFTFFISLQCFCYYLDGMKTGNLQIRNQLYLGENFGSYGQGEKTQKVCHSFYFSVISSIAVDLHFYCMSELTERCFSYCGREFTEFLGISVIFGK